MLFQALADFHRCEVVNSTREFHQGQRRFQKNFQLTLGGDGRDRTGDLRVMNPTL